LAFLSASDKALGDNFGCSVDISDSWITIGAYGNNDTGSVYMFKKPMDGWQESTETSKLSGNQKHSRFGNAVCLDSNMLAVGAKYDSKHFVHGGSMSVFQLNDTVWELQQNVFPVELKEHDYYGTTVEITGSQLFGSAIGDDDAGDYSGAVHVFGYTNPCIISQPGEQGILCGIDTTTCTLTAENVTAFEWQVSSDGGLNFTSISDNETYNGASNDSMTINVNYTMDEFLYRCILSNGDYTDTTIHFALNFEEESPVIESWPDDMEIYLTEGCAISLLDYRDSADFTDNCDGSLEISQSPVPGTMISGYPNTITITATDDAGNSSDASFIISIIDTIHPVITCARDTLIDISMADDHYVVEGSELDPLVSTDNCDILSITNDLNNRASLAGENLTQGLHEIHWSITDSAGNSNQCYSSVEIRRASGIESLTSYGLDVYPNPAVGEIYIIDTKDIVEKVEMYDISGRKVLSKNKHVENKILDVSHLTSGIYLLNIHVKDNMLTVKIIKE
jgi:hypothetical protein